MGRRSGGFLLQEASGKLADFRQDSLCIVAFQPETISRKRRTAAAFYCELPCLDLDQSRLYIGGSDIERKNHLAQNQHLQCPALLSLFRRFLCRPRQSFCSALNSRTCLAQLYHSHDYKADVKGHTYRSACRLPVIVKLPERLRAALSIEGYDNSIACAAMSDALDADTTISHGSVTVISLKTASLG